MFRVWGLWGFKGFRRIRALGLQDLGLVTSSALTVFNLKP